MSRRVAVLHHRRSFFPLELRRAVGEVAELVWVLVDDDPEDRRIRPLLERIGDVIQISSGDLESALRVLAGADLQGIATFVDDHLILTSSLADRLGLIHHPPGVAAVIRDKGKQRAALDAAGVPGPRFWSLPAGMDPQSLTTTVSGATYPAVLKPVHGSASRGIVAVESEDQLLELYDERIDQLLEEHMLDDPSSDPRFASYLSVESVVSHARISHVAITGRFPLAPPYRETGNFSPASVPAGQHVHILELATAGIDALGIRDAVVHVEIKLTPDGPRLIEINGRVGGRPPFLLLKNTDVNLFAIACRIALGETVEFDAPVDCRGLSFWRMIQPPLSARRVREIHGIDELRAEKWVDSLSVKRGAGQTVDPEEGTDGAVAAVTGTVSSLEELVSAIARVDRTLIIEYDHAPPGPRLAP